MQCHTKVIIVLALTAFKWTLSTASIIEVNETTFASFPPLYGLDAWTQCQQDGDVYCIVDADLVSAQPSPLLQLLQEYSKQTLKHYNRTRIHRGVCVSKCGQEEAHSWTTAAQNCLNQSVEQYGLQAQVTSAKYCSIAGARTDPTSARALVALTVLLVALAIVATGVHVFCEKCSSVQGNKYLLAFSLKQNWSILTYDRSKPRTDDRMRDTACLEGIRFIGMQCVIFSHVMFVYLYSYIDNPQFVEKMYDQFGWQAVMNSPVWLQAFFSMSGFLTAYSTLVSSETRPITFFKCITSIINRWVRLTPLAAFALWFTISWFPVVGAGPQWAWLVSREAADCAARWHYHLLYVHNHLPLGKFCMGHTWYLAVDMQLHALGIFIIFFLMKFRKAVAPVLGSMVVTSSVAAATVVYLFDLTPIITAQSPEALHTLFAESKVIKLLYLPMWMNLSGYAGGVATAFLLYHNQVNGIKLCSNKWFNILFHLSLHLGGCVVLTGAVFLSDARRAAWASALYSALDRTLVAGFFCVFLLGCVSRCQSAFRSLLDWRGFHFLGRLSYCAFLMHFIVLRLTLASNSQLGHATVFSLISILISASVLTYIISIPLCLLVELPAIQLWKAGTERPRLTPAPPPTEAPPRVAPQNKTFDLVAHIRRRSDV